jgi:hypothetical protein
VFGSRSRRNSNDFSTSFSAETLPPVSFCQYSGATVTVCVVVVRSETVTLNVVSSIFSMMMGIGLAVEVDWVEDQDQLQCSRFRVLSSVGDAMT